MSESPSRIFVSLPEPIWEPCGDGEIKWNCSRDSATRYEYYLISLRSFMCYQCGSDGGSFPICRDCKTLEEAKSVCLDHYLSELGAELI